MTNGTYRRPGRVEGVVQVLILLAIGGCAAAASFTHIHNLAASHGQAGWLAWADAVVLELMSIATGLEIRRRHRVGEKAGFVAWILVAAVALSLMAQVVEAERSAIGWIAAALPALGFLACVKIVLARGTSRPVGDEAFRAPSSERSLSAAVVLPVVPEQVSAQDDRLNEFQDRADQDSGRDGQDESQDGQDDTTAPLVDRARIIATQHRLDTGRDINRDQLRAALRVSNGTASDVLREVRTTSPSPRPTLPPIPADAFARVNGHTHAGGGQ